MSSFVWKASDWKFSGEGGKHAVFECMFSGGYRGRTLLRTTKEDLCCALGSPDDDQSTFYDKAGEIVTEVEAPDFFVHIIKPIFQDSFDLPLCVRLSSSFLKQLRQQALESNMIEDDRLTSWEPISNTTEKTIFAGQLLFDYRKPILFDLASHQNFFSVEIKPKAGYRPFSPLIQQSRAVKYLSSRFEIQQALKAHQARLKGTEYSPSKYNPLDLFSGELNRVKQALLDLRECPRNNMRVWLDGRVMIAEGTTVASEVLDAAIEALAAILCKTPVLNKILDLQLLDIIDGDGAVAIHNRLVHLMNEDKIEVERLVDRVRYSDCSGIKFHHQLLSTSPFAFEDDPSAILELCRAIEDSKECKGSSRSTSAFCSDVFVQNLSKNECVYLLRNWLLALAMSDCSIFVSFAITNGVPCTIVDDSVQIKLIDCDAKPAAKLRTRESKEAQYESDILISFKKE